MILNANGQQIPVTLSSAQMYQVNRQPQPQESTRGNSKQEGSLSMLDGAVDLCVAEASRSGSSKKGNTSDQRELQSKIKGLDLFQYQVQLFVTGVHDFYCERFAVPHLLRKIRAYLCI